MQIRHELIDTDAAFARLLEELARAPRIGIDTEFHRERSYWPQVALVQIAVGDKNVLVDPLAVDLSPLGQIIAGDVETIMHASEQDIEMLHLICGEIPSRLFDIQLASGFVGLSTPSLLTLVSKFTEARITKSSRLSNWLKRPLTDTQRSYAAGDVAYLFEICDRLTEELEGRGRLGWARDECELARKPPPQPLADNHVWTRISQARKLSGRPRALACCIAEWREKVARKKDIPTRFVLSDAALVEVAQQRPASATELRSLRAVSSLGKGLDRELMEALERGDAMDTNNVPAPAFEASPVLEPDLKQVVPLIGAWLDALARRERFDRALLATRNDVERLLSDPSMAQTSRLTRGWRASLVGTSIADIVEGRASIAFSRSDGIVIRGAGEEIG